MNRRLLIILLSAFVIAALSTYVVWKLVGSRLSATKPSPTTGLVAAAKDIPLGTVLSSGDLTTIQVQGTLPQGAILDPKSAIGRGVISPMYTGEPVLDSRLAPLGSGGGLAATIPDGKRAIAVKVDDVVGVAGFVTPGMHVDVLVSGVPPGAGSNGNQEARTVLQNISVLSAGTDIQKDAAGKPKQVQVVNLMVDPAQAQVLALATTDRILLVLRNPMDTSIVKVPGVDMASLFSGEKQKEPGKARVVRRVKSEPPPFTIKVYNNGKMSEEKFATPGGKQ